MNFRGVIAEDEELLRTALSSLLKEAWPQLEIVAECEDGASALESIAELQPDVAFLDIRMPGLTGIEVAAALAQVSPWTQVVFVTAYDQYAIDAFEQGAVDYLLKPVSAERLRETLSRLLPHAPPATAQGATTDVRRLPLPLGRRTVMVDEADIQLIRARGNYLDIETKRGTFTFRRTLGDFLNELDANTFLRVHRSCVIRIAAAIEVITLGSGRYRLTLDCGRQVVTGRQYREHVQRNLIGRPFGSACP